MALIALISVPDGESLRCLPRFTRMVLWERWLFSREEPIDFLVPKTKELFFLGLRLVAEFELLWFEFAKWDWFLDFSIVTYFDYGTETLYFFGSGEKIFGSILKLILSLLELLTSHAIYSSLIVIPFWSVALRLCYGSTDVYDIICWFPL